MSNISVPNAIWTKSTVTYWVLRQTLWVLRKLGEFASAYNTLWHESITKIIPWELFSVIFKGTCTLEISGKERLFPEITRQVRNFSKRIISEYFFVSEKSLCQRVIGWEELTGLFPRNLVRTQTCLRKFGQCFGNPNPYNFCLKSTAVHLPRLYGSPPPICIAVLSWLLSFEERECAAVPKKNFKMTMTMCVVPLARNRYINDLPGIFSCMRAGASTGATCIRTEMNSLHNLATIRKMIPQKYFPVFAAVRIQAPHAFTQKLIPQDFFPAHVLVLCRGVSLSCGILGHGHRSSPP